MVGAVVGGKRVGLAVEVEATGGDAIGIAAAGRAKVWMAREVAVEGVEPEHDVDGITGAAIFRRHEKRRHDRTVVGDRRLPATRHSQRVEVGRPAVGQRAEGFHGGHVHRRRSRRCS